MIMLGDMSMAMIVMFMVVSSVMILVVIIIIVMVMMAMTFSEKMKMMVAAGTEKPLPEHPQPYTQKYTVSGSSFCADHIGCNKSLSVAGFKGVESTKSYCTGVKHQCVGHENILQNIFTC